MNNESYYAIQLSFHPDPKIESKNEFSTKSEAEKHIQAFAQLDQFWIIIHRTNNKYDVVRKLKYY